MKSGAWAAVLALFVGLLLADMASPAGAIGVLAAVGTGLWVLQRQRLDALEERLKQQAAKLASVAAQAELAQQRVDALLAARREAPSPEAAPSITAAPTTVQAPPPVKPAAATGNPAGQALAPAPAAAAPAVHAPAAKPAAAPTLEPDEHSAVVTSSLGASLQAWFTGGNTIVRLAVLVLFVGVAFLVRYAAENALLPIELRLTGAVGLGMALVWAGWRLRGQRRGYALTLQGGGVGVVYLVLFAAFRLYHLLPAGLAFVLLVAVGVCTTLLALRQDAQPLAALAFAGGFLAPVLTSTGQGSHMALFSFYLVLNLSIAWLATRRAWRLLNVLGFGFTVAIGSAWGLSNWEPALLPSTEPFLLAHLALYLFITVQYSLRLLAQQDDRLPLVDGGLLFGVPIAAFGLQAGMVAHLPYGVAVSAALLSAVYLGLTRWLWRRAGERLRVLSEGLLALGVVFLALVAPLALDGRWTAAAWALQGAGVAWVALRQRRPLALGLGLLLQGLAALSFWSLGALTDDTLAWPLNARLVGALLLSASALFCARQLLHAADPVKGGLWRLGPPALDSLHHLLLAAGVAHALAGVGLELYRAPWRVPEAEQMLRMWLALAAVGLAALRWRLQWVAAGTASRGLIGAALVVSALALIQDATGLSSGTWPNWRDGGLAELAWLWLAALWLLRRDDHADDATARSPAISHLLLYGHALVAVAALAHAVGGATIARHEAWTAALPLAAPLLLMLALLVQARRGTWPAARHADALRRFLAWPLAGLALVWSWVVNLLVDGAMWPLPYLPLLNPLDLAHGLLVLYVVRLWRDQPPRDLGPMAVLGLLAASGFWWINALAVRTLHHWADTPRWLDGALQSGTVQATLSLLWTLCALVAMFTASRRLLRLLWIGGAALLGAVVLKLLLVDLSHTGALMRIVSFIGVGLLMLVIGYLSPLPPAHPERQP